MKLHSPCCHRFSSAVSAAPSPNALFSGQDDPNRHRLSGRRRQRSLAAADRPAHGQIYSRQSQLHRAEHARGQLDDRGQLRLQRRQAGRPHTRLDRSHALLRSARRPQRSEIRLGQIQLHRLAGAKRAPSLHARRYPVQNHRRRAQSQRAAQMRFRRRHRHRLLFSRNCSRKRSAPSSTSCSAIKAAAPSIWRWKKARSNAAP